MKSGWWQQCCQLSECQLRVITVYLHSLLFQPFPSDFPNPHSPFPSFPRATEWPQSSRGPRRDPFRCVGNGEGSSTVSKNLMNFGSQTRKNRIRALYLDLTFVFSTTSRLNGNVAYIGQINRKRRWKSQWVRGPLVLLQTYMNFGPQTARK